MQSVKFSENSWHARLARKYQIHYLFDGDEIYHRDICSYIRGVGRGLFMAILMVLIPSYLLGSTINGIAFLFGGEFNNFFKLGMFFWGLVGYLLAIAIVLALGCVVSKCIYHFVIDHPRQRSYILEPLEPKPKEPSFLLEVYRKFKDKTCVRVEFYNDRSEKELG